jgi:cbb3-type cytochrome c oxidase subunit III
MILNAALLRTDPDRLQEQPSLLAFAALEARPLYSQKCAGCHGADLKGDHTLGAPNLTDAEWIYGQGRIAEIERTIAYGVRSGHPKTRNLSAMPTYASQTPYAREKLNPLAPGQIDDVVDYILAIEGRTPRSTAAAERGQSLFLGYGGCYDCHTSDARGDNFVGAPSLRDQVWLYGDGSPAAIFASIARGRAGVCPAWTGRLSPANIRALAAFVYRKSHPPSAPDRKG